MALVSPLRGNLQEKYFSTITANLPISVAIWNILKMIMEPIVINCYKTISNCEKTSDGAALVGAHLLKDFSKPHICHFFYTGRILENQILHPKKQLKAPKTLKMSLKKSNICVFSLNLEKFTPDTKFLHRHNKYEVCSNTGYTLDCFTKIKIRNPRYTKLIVGPWANRN